ncbi:Myb family transcription factor EFM [Canna indica]|uniref:Myb family transcription factor EFM n=1 Tax=Canna indica TaxID=4628 RepID=A0AAQ3KI13_9LILI|nr:Myb family transcription factor EFM [Canna indica]
MGSAAAEIILDLKLFTARTIAGFLKEASATDGGDGMMAKLEESMRSLEEEKRKIEAFKRELPLCMNLLTDVIEGLEKELDQCRSQRCTRVFGQFISFNSKFEDEGRVRPEKGRVEKMNWMSSAQLWNDNSARKNGKDDKNEKKAIEEGGGELNRQKTRKENLFTESKTISGGGAFVPFKALSAMAANSKEEKPAAVFPDLSLQAPAIDNGALTLSTTTEDNRVSGSGPAPSKAGELQITEAHQQPPRKVRRCWSPELHRRFLFALQQLGGAQVATPKQIRELMKVDGLTNDEVKSHLQKYRLHSRKMPNSSGSASRSLSMAGSACVPEEQQLSNSSQQSDSKAGSPQSPLQLTGSNQALSITAGDSCEEEDGKSESYSWK